MKITVYTITDCEFSREEKEYLASHQLQFEEKNLETNKEFLTEMLAVSNNFAGTPVTKIEKDDGKIEVLKGFTKEEFDELLGLAPTKKEEPPTPSDSGQAAVSPAPTKQPATPTTPQTNDPLNSILADLQAKSVAQTTTNNPTNQSSNPSTNPLPSVPDFPAKT